MHSHYFDSTFTSDAHYTITQEVANKQLTLHSTAGVFSAQKFDQGTCILLNTMYAYEHNYTTQGGRRLDLCTGYGLVGARRLMDTPTHQRSIHGVEINTRALACAQHNRNNIHKLTSKQNNSSKGEKTNDINQTYALHHEDAHTRTQTHTYYYDVIAVNPPFACGKQRCQKLLSLAIQSLTPQGSLRAVLPTRRGAKSYERHLQQTHLHHRTALIHKEKGYRVYRITPQ